jgi:hypothetical protein
MDEATNWLLFVLVGVAALLWLSHIWRGGWNRDRDCDHHVQFLTNHLKFRDDIIREQRQRIEALEKALKERDG